MSGRWLRGIAVLGGGLILLVTGAGCGGSGALVEVAVGGNRSCVRFEDGTVTCWGGHATLQSLGKAYPGTLVPKKVEGLQHPSRLCAGSVFACALDEGGRVRCWTPEKEPRATETAGLSDATALFCGDAGGCTLDSGGTARCWDWIPDGPGTIETVNGLKGATSIAIGADHRCALKDDGSVWCWGDNQDGQLGVSPTGLKRSDAPVQAQGVATVTAIAAGADFTCALGQDQKVRCFGSNEVGQLGHQGASTVRASEVTGLSDAVELAAGARHACARTADGAVQCWGFNLNGQLGDGSDEHRFAATAVKNVSGVRQLGLGAAHTCARTEDALFCWGHNLDGQLGDGTFDGRLLPAEVDLAPR